MDVISHVDSFDHGFNGSSAVRSNCYVDLSFYPQVCLFAESLH